MFPALRNLDPSTTRTAYEGGFFRTLSCIVLMPHRSADCCARNAQLASRLKRPIQFKCMRALALTLRLRA
jgi:hypothetical protein